MNLKAAAIAWELVMEHNQVYRALTSVMHPRDDESWDYNVEKNGAFKFVYGIVMRTIDVPDTDVPEDVKEFWARTLDEKSPAEWLRQVISPYGKAPGTPGS